MPTIEVVGDKPDPKLTWVATTAIQGGWMTMVQFDQLTPAVQVCIPNGADEYTVARLLQHLAEQVVETVKKRRMG